MTTQAADILHTHQPTTLTRWSVWTLDGSTERWACEREAAPYTTATTVAHEVAVLPHVTCVVLAPADQDAAAVRVLANSYGHWSPAPRAKR